MSFIIPALRSDLFALLDRALTNASAPEPVSFVPEMDSFVNPLNVSFVTFVCVTLLKAAAEEMLNAIIVNVLALSKHSLLPSRVPTPMMRGLETLAPKDYLFLFINQFVEAVFLMHLAALALSLPKVLAELTVFNSVGAFYLTYLIDDFVYYWAHRAMHLPLLYPLCHKHHHRQALPKRGYLDAANEHPIEQVVGLGCVWLAVHAAIRLTGFHAATIVVFFGTYASLAMLNHTPYDVKLGWLMLGYEVRAHEMHHRIPRSNYAQNTMIFDRLMSTFQPYVTPSAKEVQQDKKNE